MQESINRDLEELKNKHTETKKNSAQISTYMKISQTTGPTLGVQK